MNQNKTYRVNDIFYTLQGEGFHRRGFCIHTACRL